MSAQAIRVPHPALRPRVLRARLYAAAGWALGALVVITWLAFVPLAGPRVLAALLAHFGA